MTNKFHKAYQVGQQIYSKLVKDKTKSKAEQLFDNVYKKDLTGKKDKAIQSMNEFLKKKKRSASPGMVDRYHAIMTSDPQYRPGYWKKKEGKK